MNVVAKAAQQAIALLNALKADFKIILPTGEEYGNLEIVRPKIYKRNQNYKRGTLIGVFLPIIESMEVGDVRVVEVPEGIEPDHMRGAMTGHISKRWGKGSAKTCVNGNTVEILRVQ
jgi:hypothetical protein